MKMVKKLIAVAFVLAPGFVEAQIPAPSQEQFEVVSIRPHKQVAEEGLRFNKCAGGRLVASNTPVSEMIVWAYDALHRFEAPSWATFGGEAYDVEATASHSLTIGQCKAMVRSMLEDRFRLVLHREKKDVRGYALLVAKGGSKLVPAVMEDPKASDGIWISGDKIGARGWEPPLIAWWLSTLQAVGKPVVDQTGLNGFYQFKIDFSFASGGDGDKPDIFAALPAQLGLRLESKVVSIETVVIDRLEKPSAN